MDTSDVKTNANTSRSPVTRRMKRRSRREKRKKTSEERGPTFLTQLQEEYQMKNVLGSPTISIQKYFSNFDPRSEAENSIENDEEVLISVSQAVPRSYRLDTTASKAPKKLEIPLEAGLSKVESWLNRNNFADVDESHESDLRSDQADGNGVANCKNIDTSRRKLVYGLGNEETVASEANDDPYVFVGSQREDGGPPQTKKLKTGRRSYAKRHVKQYFKSKARNNGANSASDGAKKLVTNELSRSNVSKSSQIEKTVKKSMSKPSKKSETSTQSSFIINSLDTFDQLLAKSPLRQCKRVPMVSRKLANPESSSDYEFDPALLFRSPSAGCVTGAGSRCRSRRKSQSRCDADWTTNSKKVPTWKPTNKDKDGLKLKHLQDGDINIDGTVIRRYNLRKPRAVSSSPSTMKSTPKKQPVVPLDVLTEKADDDERQTDSSASTTVSWIPDRPNGVLDVDSTSSLEMGDIKRELIEETTEHELDGSTNKQLRKEQNSVVDGVSNTAEEVARQNDVDEQMVADCSENETIDYPMLSESKGLPVDSDHSMAERSREENCKVAERPRSTGEPQELVPVVMCPMTSSFCQTDPVLGDDIGCRKCQTSTVNNENGVSQKTIGDLGVNIKENVVRDVLMKLDGFSVAQFAQGLKVLATIVEVCQEHLPNQTSDVPRCEVLEDSTKDNETVVKRIEMPETMIQNENLIEKTVEKSILVVKDQIPTRVSDDQSDQIEDKDASSHSKDAPIDVCMVESDEDSFSELIESEATESQASLDVGDCEVQIASLEMGQSEYEASLRSEPNEPLRNDKTDEDKVLRQSISTKENVVPSEELKSKKKTRRGLAMFPVDYDSLDNVPVDKVADEKTCSQTPSSLNESSDKARRSLFPLFRTSLFNVLPQDSTIKAWPNVSMELLERQTTKKRKSESKDLQKTKSPTNSIDSSSKKRYKRIIVNVESSSESDDNAEMVLEDAVQLLSQELADPHDVRGRPSSELASKDAKNDSDVEREILKTESEMLQGIDEGFRETLDLKLSGNRVENQGESSQRRSEVDVSSNCIEYFKSENVNDEAEMDEEDENRLKRTQSQYYPCSGMSTETEYFDTQGRENLMQEIDAKKEQLLLWEQQLKKEQEKVTTSKRVESGSNPRLVMNGNAETSCQLRTKDNSSSFTKDEKNVSTVIYGQSKPLATTNTSMTDLDVASNNVSDSESTSTKRKMSRRLSQLSGSIFVVSGLNAEEMTKVQSFLRMHNAEMADTVTRETTHVIVKTNSKLISGRTFKFLMGVAYHCFILSYKWVEDCLKRNCLLNKDCYEVLGDTISGFHYGPKNSCRSSSSSLLFEGYEMFCPEANSDISDEDWQTLLEVCGATVVSDPSLFTQNPRRKAMIIFQDSTNSEGNYKRLYDSSKVNVVDRDWVVTSIASYKLQPLKPFLLLGHP